MKTSYNVAVVGATGMVGQKIIDVLAERNFPINKLYPLASKNSAGKQITFAGQDVEVLELTEHSFDKDIDIALFAAGSTVSEHYIPIALDHGVKVVDNSSFYRMDDQVPLIIPEVNGEVLTEETQLVANPNCSTIQSLMVIKPLYDAFGVKRIIYNTYQSTSGSGVKGVKALKEGSPGAYPYSIQTNTLPHIDDFLDNGYTKEEMKMVNESKKLLDDQDLKITATAVRVPIESSHAISINIELNKDADSDDLKQCLNQAPGVIVKDDPKADVYPLQDDSSGTDDIFVGRIRKDYSQPKTFNLWCTGDNIRKGAATNTVQIAELFTK